MENFNMKLDNSIDKTVVRAVFFLFRKHLEHESLFAFNKQHKTSREIEKKRKADNEERMSCFDSPMFWYGKREAYLELTRILDSIEKKA